MGLFSGDDFKPGCGDEMVKVMGLTVLAVAVAGFGWRFMKAWKR